MLPLMIDDDDDDKDDDDKDDDDKDDGDNDDDDNDDGDDNDGDDDNDDGDNDNADDDNDDGDNDNADDDNGDNGDADDDNDNDDGDDDDGDDDNDDGDNDNADNDDGDNDNADDDNDDGDTDDNGDDDGDNDDNDDAGDDDNDDGDDDDDDNDDGDNGDVDDNDDGDDDNDCTQDILSDILFETRLDPYVLELLVSEMERGLALRNSVTFKEPKSLYVLPFLLRRLRPREIVLKFRHSEVSKNFSALNKTLGSASRSRKMIYIRMDLSEFKQLAGQEEVLYPVDYLRLDVREDGYEELESLHHPFSLLTSSADELRLRYFMFYAPEDRIAQVMNRTLAPTSRVGGGATDLVIQFMRDLDVELLLQLLILPPLRNWLFGRILIQRLMMWKN
ncbi:uncharacterized protein [Macrobrachium rosenbergii]|uniref:uncharacterized protein n=1 Tax=Macrobrachium rosenbergii TaxID=79674 RepID=UPI0034D7144A